MPVSDTPTKWGRNCMTFQKCQKAFHSSPYIRVEQTSLVSISQARTAGGSCPMPCIPAISFRQDFSLRGAQLPKIVLPKTNSLSAKLVRLSAWAIFSCQCKKASLSRDFGVSSNRQAYSSALARKSSSAWGVAR